MFIMFPAANPLGVGIANLASPAIVTKAALTESFERMVSIPSLLSATSSHLIFLSAVDLRSAGMRRRSSDVLMRVEIASSDAAFLLGRRRQSEQFLVWFEKGDRRKCRRSPAYIYIITS